VSAHFTRRFIQPLVVPIGIFIVAAAIIVTIGETLLGLFEEGRNDLKRPELYFAVLLALAILGICAYIATRPEGALGRLDRELAIGKKPILEPLPEWQPLDQSLRHGPTGTVADIAPGYFLYARSGALAQVIDVLKGVEEHGRVRSGLIYAKGVHGASDELWIPFEAVSAVYPETNSAFLAIKGDETEAFGWNRPPMSFSRQPRPEPPRMH
jgi:hypothetical protein